MGNMSQYYEAMMEGRWRPTIDVDRTEDGKWRASYTDNNGTVLEATDELQSFAVNQVQGMLKDGAMNGTINPR